MAKEKDAPVVDVEGALTRTEIYLEENKKSLTIIGVAILALAGLFVGYKFWYVPEQDAAAKEKLFMVENAFAKDSFNIVISGNVNTPGAEEIADEYSATPSGNLARYMAGISYLRTGKYQEAIDNLEDFESDDQVLSSIALGATGDAYMELGNVEEAIDHYLKAAGTNANKFTSPIYLKKAGIAYEEKGQFQDAVKVYEQIKNDYPESAEGREIEKYLARAKTFAGTGA